MYDTIIISEKPIAGQSIAQILSNNTYSTKQDKGVSFFEFNHKDFGKTILVPLKGHIKDVDFTKEYSNWYINLKRIVDNEPIYYKETQPNIIKVLNGVLAKKVIVATDADREGESIGNEAVDCLLKKNPKIEIKRAYFSAITKEELNKAFSNTLDLNKKMADSADARREIDLYWGAILTRFLSTYTGQTGKNFLSVGRVQSPTLAKVVEKELEIENFISEPFWEIEIILNKENTKFKAEYKKGRIYKKEDAEKIFSQLGNKAKIIKLEKKEGTIEKPIPFNTTDFLRAAAAINIDAIKAMNIAENLYMKGYISYPRTDNQTYIGVVFENILKELKCSDFNSIINKILALPKIIPSKGISTKDHPPIHPVTLPEKEKLSKEEWKVFKLITDHFLATLYLDAKTIITNIELDVNKEIFFTKGIIFIDKGFLEYYPYVNQKENLLPNLELNEILEIIKKDLLSKKTKPPARYSQGTLIKLMEKLNLGTKSTRPAILEKLYSRDYISGKKQILPSKVSKIVVKTLEDYANHVVNVDMTSKLENEMNDIEEGKTTKKNVVKDSLIMLSEILDELYKNKDEISKNIKKTFITKVGVCPICKKDLITRKSKMGKNFVGCSGYPNCKQTYPLPQKGNIVFTTKFCELCKAPIIKLNDVEICINLNCLNNKEKKLENK